MDDAIKAKKNWKAGELPFFRSAHGLLVGVKDAWRNDCMHAEGKFDRPDAVRIFDAVHGFMDNFAKLPKAKGRAKKSGRTISAAT